jgi:hypothetical protein
MKTPDWYNRLLTISYCIVFIIYIICVNYFASEQKQLGISEFLWGAFLTFFYGGWIVIGLRAIKFIKWGE